MCSSSIESSKSSRTFSQNGRNPSTRSKIRRIESWEDFLLVTVQHPSLHLWKKKAMQHGFQPAQETGIPRSIFIELLTLDHYDLFPRSHLFSAFLLLVDLLARRHSSIRCIAYDPIRGTDPMNKCRSMQRIVA